MLRSLVIASGSGLVLFEKEWAKEFELVRLHFGQTFPLNSTAAFLLGFLTFKVPFPSLSNRNCIYHGQGAKWGALIRSLEEFAVQCVGLNVTYMDFPNGMLTITRLANLQHHS